MLKAKKKIWCFLFFQLRLYPSFNVFKNLTHMQSFFLGRIKKDAKSPFLSDYLHAFFRLMITLYFSGKYFLYLIKSPAYAENGIFLV